MIFAFEEQVSMKSQADITAGLQTTAVSHLQIQTTK